MKNLLIKVAVFVDFKMYQFWDNIYKEKSEEYITNFVNVIMDSVNIIFNEPVLERQMHIKMVRLEILKSQPTDLIADEDAATYKYNFCPWQNALQLKNSMKWDHAILLTGLNIASKGDFNVVGQSSMYGMCESQFSCTIAEGFNFVSVSIITHELGHSFGMDHDAIDNDCGDTFIMSSTPGEGKTTWSPCSKQTIDNFIRLNRPCVQNLFEPFSLANSSQLPGQRFDADQQCQLNFGLKAFAIKETRKKSCSMLYCSDGDSPRVAHPALEGTLCEPGKWCQNGKCVSWNGFGPKVIDGGWSAWSEFSECRGSCLKENKGIKVASRLCNNPVPYNEGKSCIGMDKKYQICELNCRQPRSSIQEFADNECQLKKKDDPKFSGQGLQLFSDWSARCQVWCYWSPTDYSNFGVTFPDGTNCNNGNEKINLFCIEGKCKKFDESGSMVDENLSSEVDFTDFWIDWEMQGSCESDCLNVNFGVQLYKKVCRNKKLDVVKCIHDESYYKMCDATELCETKNKITKAEFADELCKKNQNHDSSLSGKSFQFNYDQSFPQRSCKIFCLTKNKAIRNFGQNYPNGTLCSTSLNAICIKGICKVVDHHNKIEV